MKRPFSAYKGDEPYVFVCYAHENADGVYPELQRLHDAGVRIWYDEGVSPGARWSDELARALSGAALVLFFCTPQSAKSKHCQDEVNFALDEQRPLLVIQDGVVDLPPGMRLQLGPQQSILKHELSAQQFVDKLAAAINRHLGAPTASGSAQRRWRQAVLAGASPCSPRSSWLSPGCGVCPSTLPACATACRVTVPGPISSRWRYCRSKTFPRIRSQDYFADGMTEMLTANLAQISGLRVISRTSAMQYKGAHKSLPEIARELNVDAIVEGSVLSSEGKVRITAQLIYAPDDQHLWARDLRSKPQRRVVAAKRSGTNHRGSDRGDADAERGTAADWRPARRSRGSGRLSQGQVLLAAAGLRPGESEESLRILPAGTRKRPPLCARLCRNCAVLQRPAHLLAIDAGRGVPEGQGGSDTSARAGRHAIRRARDPGLHQDVLRLGLGGCRNRIQALACPQLERLHGPALVQPVSREFGTHRRSAGTNRARTGAGPAGTRPQGERRRDQLFWPPL